MVDLTQRRLKDVDWLLLLAPIALTVFGCVAISTSAPDTGFVKKQAISLGIGLAIAIAIMFTDYRKIVVRSHSPSPRRAEAGFWKKQGISLGLRLGKANRNNLTGLPKDLVRCPQHQRAGYWIC